MTTKLTPWLFRIRVEDRPGIMAAIAATFSRRGIQVESFHGYGAPLTLGQENPEGLVLASFKAYDYRMNSLQRVLSRLQQVKQVEVFNLVNCLDMLKTVTVRYNGKPEQIQPLIKPTGVSFSFLETRGLPPVLVLHGNLCTVDKALSLIEKEGLVATSEYVLMPPDR